MNRGSVVIVLGVLYVVDVGIKFFNDSNLLSFQKIDFLSELASF
jgi:hypothetical protein